MQFDLRESRIPLLAEVSGNHPISGNGNHGILLSGSNPASRIHRKNTKKSLNKQ